MTASLIPHPRKPCGRRRQRYLPREADRFVAFIAAQPHRRGERSNAGGSAWQRALKAGLLADSRPNGFTAGELEAAGLAFAEARINGRKAMASRMPFSSRGSGPSRGDIPPHVVARWRKQFGEVCACLRRHGDHALSAIVAAIDAHPDADERAWDPEFRVSLSLALVALAKHFRIRA